MRRKPTMLKKNGKGGDAFYFCMPTQTQMEYNDVWYINNGCSNHMTRIKKNFVKLNDNFLFSINFGDDKARDTINKSVISMQSK